MGKHKVLFQELTKTLDGWSYIAPDGTRYHDCCLGGLIGYLKAVGHLQVGETVKLLFLESSKLKIIK